MQQNIMPGPQHPVYQSPVKTFTNQAVIAFFLYWAFWLPGLIASMIWWFEANNVLKNSGIKPEGYTALLIEMVLGFIPILLFIMFVAGVILTAIGAGLAGAH
jgi:hypothetical protein